MQSCKPSFTPMDANVKLSRDMCPQTLEEKQIMDKIPYRRIVGCLIYTMLCTRLDIAFVVGTVSQYLEDPSVKRWSVVKRIIRYLHGSNATHRVHYGPGSRGEDTQVVVYCDTDWQPNGFQE